jgi:hypothetical protein
VADFLARPMATIAPHLFPKTEEGGDEQEQLMRLFWNRAELKKELEQLRDDCHRLSEEIKKQEGKTLRVQERLQQLELRLANPEHSMTVVVFYQLRGIWEHCHSRLAALSAELDRAHYDKGQRQHMAAFTRKVNDSLAGVQAELKAMTEKAELLSARIKALREKRGLRRGIWNIFARRKLTAEINELRADRRLYRFRIAELAEEIRVRSASEAPEFEGVDIASRRNINITLIAYAQELYLHFADRDLAARAREAAIRQMTDVSYGNKRDCRALSKYIEDRMKLLAADDKLQTRVQVRAERLARNVTYRQDNDAVPSAAVLGSIPILKPDGRERGEVAVNILGEEYWDVFAILLT